jgi:hypothetical protein
MALAATVSPPHWPFNAPGIGRLFACFVLVQGAGLSRFSWVELPPASDPADDYIFLLLLSRLPPSSSASLLLVVAPAFVFWQDLLTPVGPSNNPSNNPSIVDSEPEDTPALPRGPSLTTEHLGFLFLPP